MDFRYIQYQTIVDAVASLAEKIAHELPADVKQYLLDAAQRETSPRAKRILEQLIENYRIAQERHIPLCQDTGLSIAFVDLGASVAIATPRDKSAATLIDAINEGISLGCNRGYLRKSVVAEPLNTRKNTGTNTPAIVHLSIVPGDRLRISLMAKGGGCENKSRFKMFNPTQGEKDIAAWIVDVIQNAGANACPPLVAGVGLGGDFEQCCLLSKKSLLRKMGSEHPDPFYAKLEKDIFAAANATNLGPQGLGGDTTVLAVFIETAPCHIASLPVAVNIECHSHRHGSLEL